MCPGNVHLFFPLRPHLITLGVLGGKYRRKKKNETPLRGFKRDTETFFLKKETVLLKKEIKFKTLEYYTMVIWKR